MPCGSENCISMTPEAVRLNILPPAVGITSSLKTKHRSRRALVLERVIDVPLTLHTKVLDQFPLPGRVPSDSHMCYFQESTFVFHVLLSCLNTTCQVCQVEMSRPA